MILDQIKQLQDENYRAMYLKVRDELAELQQREWVGLTDGQIYSMVADITDVRSPYLQFARAIEAAHGIKE